MPIPLLTGGRAYLDRAQRHCRAVGRCSRITAVLALLVSPPVAATAAVADARPPEGAIVFFARPAQDATMLALGAQSIAQLKRVCNRLGRFRPVENNRLRAAVASMGRGPADEFDQYRAVAASLGVDWYVVLSHYMVGKDTVGEMRIEPVAPAFSSYKNRIRVRSRILKNVPLKLGREFALLQRDEPVRGVILSRTDSGTAIVNIGQWHGIERGKRYETTVGGMLFTETGRYESAVRIEGGRGRPGDPVIIARPPDYARLAAELETHIARNAEGKYGLRDNELRGDDDRKRLIEGLCVINLGGNVCVPGYGAYLSTSYMGFADPSPDIPGIVLAATMVVSQLTIPEFMTGFHVNFFPWEKDENKTPALHSLQIFLWSTIPLTFSAAYFDQLAVQYHKFERLPPFFSNHDEAAALFSLIFPGGGLFYKGYRAGGWSYFLAELALAGYAVYWMNDDSGDAVARNSGAYALAAFGVIKIVELLNAYFISPSYTFYNIETEREYRSAELYFDMRPGCREQKGMEYRLGLLYRM